MRTRIGDGAAIQDSVIMGSDIYQVRGMCILDFFYFIELPKTHKKSTLFGFPQLYS